MVRCKFLYNDGVIECCKFKRRVVTDTCKDIGGRRKCHSSIIEPIIEVRWSNKDV